MLRRALAALLSLTILPVMADERVTLKLGTQHWPPYQYYEDGSLEGIAIDALGCAMNGLGYDYEIVVKPWRRVQVEVASGSLDAFFAASQSSGRDRFATQSVPFIRQSWSFYLLKDHPLLQQPRALSPGLLRAQASVAARQNSNVWDWLDTNGYRVTVTPLDAESLIRTLMRRRVDTVMENSAVFSYQLRLMGVDPDRFEAVENIDHDLGVYFGHRFIAANPGFLQAFNRNARRCSMLENK